MFFKRKKKPVVPVPGDRKPNAAEPSFIGRNCVFEGHINCDGELHIDGTVRGTVQAGLCVVDAAGVVQGTVTGQVVHVRGRVLGPIQASSVIIHAGAHVEGDIFNDTISIENGAYVFGSMRQNAGTPQSAALQKLVTNGEIITPNKAAKQTDLRVISSRK